MDKILCEFCNKEILEKPKQTFLGFQNYKCASCGKETLYPLTTGYRMIYWVILLCFGFGALRAIQTGNFFIPGVLGIATVVGLIQDRNLTKKLNVHPLK